MHHYVCVCVCVYHYILLKNCTVSPVHQKSHMAAISLNYHLLCVICNYTDIITINYRAFLNQLACIMSSKGLCVCVFAFVLCQWICQVNKVFGWCYIVCVMQVSTTGCVPQTTTTTKTKQHGMKVFLLVSEK